MIEIDGETAGLIQYYEKRDPKYRHADLFLDPALHGRGWGEQAVRRVVGLLTVERGHHRVTIDPAADKRLSDPLLRKGRLSPKKLVQAAIRNVGRGAAYHDKHIRG